MLRRYVEALLTLYDKQSDEKAVLGGGGQLLFLFLFFVPIRFPSFIPVTDDQLR